MGLIGKYAIQQRRGEEGCFYFHIGQAGLVQLCSAHLDGLCGKY